MAISSEPEFLICVNCETPCYQFEWNDGKVTEAFCAACGEDDVEVFMTPEEFEALESG